MPKEQDLWAACAADVTTGAGKAFVRAPSRAERVAALKRRRVAREAVEGGTRQREVVVHAVRWLTREDPAPVLGPRSAPVGVSLEHQDVARSVRAGRTQLSYRGWTIAAYPSTHPERPGGAALVEATPLDRTHVPEGAEHLVAWRVDLGRALDLQITEAVIAMLGTIDTIAPR